VDAVWDGLWQATRWLGGAVAVGLVAGWLSGHLLRGLGRLRSRAFVDSLHRSCHRPWTASLVALALHVALPRSGLEGEPLSVLEDLLRLGAIGVLAWLAVKVVFVVEDAVFNKVRTDVSDNRRARRLRTQLALLRRATAVVVVVVALGAMLTTFDQVRVLGTSLLASAGVVGVVAGVAAQSTLGNVFAGMQLAFTDAIRLEDAVVVEGEWGWVEELTLTYVVIHLWDERRLVLPTSFFTTQPFQNWTRKQSRVLGEVTLHLDYSVPVEAVRKEAHRIVDASPLWDRQAWVLQVVDTTPSTMVVRVLASAADAPTAFDLRCEVREKLLAYVQQAFPGGLPKIRVASVDPTEPYPAERPGDVTVPGRGRSQFSSGDTGPIPVQKG
jgi:small-conductance mechanosensitive channel